jgi:hypothetical protein
MHWACVRACVRVARAPANCAPSPTLSCAFLRSDPVLVSHGSTLSGLAASQQYVREASSLQQPVWPELDPQGTVQLGAAQHEELQLFVSKRVLSNAGLAEVAKDRHALRGDSNGGTPGRDGRRRLGP